MEERLEKLQRKFKERFSVAATDVFSSPGRIELLGNHTDHNNGKVLVSSVNVNILAVTKKNPSEIIFISEGYKEMHVKLDEVEYDPKEDGTSLALIKGTVKKMKDLGYNVDGFLCYCDSTIFKGAGVSSSAAFEVLVAKIISYYYNDDKIAPFILATIGQFAESVYFNKPCGLLDQSGIALGGVNYIDFKDTTNPFINHLETEIPGYQFILINTGDDHTKLTSCYAAIKDEMADVSHFFNKKVLREVDEEEFYKHEKEIIAATSERAFLRAKHYFEENKRVEKAYNALKEKDFVTFLEMMNASGKSSYYQLQNCYVSSEDEKLPSALRYTRELDNQAYIRVHGGGFAGTMLMVISNDKIPTDVPVLEKHFGKENVMLVSLAKEGTIHVKSL